MPASSPRRHPAGGRVSRAKIVATLGPASADPATLTALLRAGMDVARLNFSHGDHAWHARTIRRLRAAARRLGRSVAVIADLPGPKIRTGPLRGGGPVMLRAGGTVRLTGRDEPGDASRLGIAYPRLARDVRPGDRVLLSDGLIELRVRRIARGDVSCVVVHGGLLREHQGVNLPGARLAIGSLTPRDRVHLRFALGQGVDYVAQSFVRGPADVLALKRLIARAGRDTPVLAKIEKPEALENLDAILAVADGVMVARGDLGVEMSPESVPVAQKAIIRRANERRRPVITATQMLESMIENPRPTRAEASDVANAVFDGTDALMLSGETASGRHPVEAVAMMDRIIARAEAAIDRVPRRRREEGPLTVAETISQAAAQATDHLAMRGLVVFTTTGSTARLVSKWRPTVPIVAFSPERSVRRRMALYWGVVPRRLGHVRGVERLEREVARRLREEGYARRGDRIGIIAGAPFGRPGSANLFEIVEIG
jgi:pyruvate kinase